MQRVCGILLIVLGVLAVLPALLTMAQPVPPNVEPGPYMVGRMLGAACCVLVPVVGGVTLLMTQAKARHRRPRFDDEDEDEDFDDRPRRRRDDRDD